MVCYYWMRFFVRWARHAKKTSQIFSYFFEFWNFLDVVNLCALFCTIGFHFSARRQSLKLVRDDGFTTPDSDGYYERLNYIMELYILETYFFTLNVVLSFLKILMFLRLNNRLNILTRTLSATAQNIIGLLIIFTLLVTGYAFCAILLYGTAMFDFRNTSASFSQLFRTLIGEFDYFGMRQEQRSLTFIFFWSYIILGLFALLNFLTAIIGSGFEEEASKSQQLPLHAQIRRARLRLRNTHCCRWCSELCSRRRFRQDIITDYLFEYRRSLLGADNLTLDQIADGEEDEPEYVISREALGNMIPQTEMDYITEEFLDEMWYEIAEDYEAELHNEEHQEKERITQAYEYGMSKGFVNVFLNKRSKLIESQQVVLSGPHNALKAGKEYEEKHEREQVRLTRKGSIGSRLSRQDSMGNMSAGSDPISGTKATPRGPGSDLGVAIAEEDPEAPSTEELLNALLKDSSDLNHRREVELILSGSDTKARMQSADTSGLQQLEIRISELESATASVHQLLARTATTIVAALEKKK